MSNDWDWIYNYDDYDDEEILNDAMRMLEEMIKEIESYPTERPIFSEKQIMSFEDLIEDHLYTMHYREGSSNIVQFKSLTKGNRGWRINYVVSGYTHISSVYLSDTGVMPYENGKWNPTNYMTEAD